ncbi:MAG: HNH endonuclease [Alphaproteobacteria bacterium]
MRYVPKSVRTQVYRQYGLEGNHTGMCDTEQGCELDHLVPLSLGGSNDASNLWPQSYDTGRWNARVKDRLENRLHRLVCVDGMVTLHEAQEAFARDWVAAAVRYGVVDQLEAMNEEEE